MWISSQLPNNQTSLTLLMHRAGGLRLIALPYETAMLKLVGVFRNPT